MNGGASSWDPFKLNEIAPSAAAVRRINKEIEEYSKDPAEDIYLVQDDETVTTLHALIIGPKDTPYENGFFYFFLKIPHNYPFSPPLVKLMTTGGGKVRFNPNLYECGKVCLSILGTWAGPPWTPGYRMKGVLISIQSLMGKEPFYNEPGFTKSKSHEPQSKNYNLNIEYETLRVAVLDMVEDKNADARNMPQVLKDKVKELFWQNVDYYKAKLLQLSSDATGSNNNKNYNYKALENRLDALIRKSGSLNSAKGFLSKMLSFQMLPVEDGNATAITETPAAEPSAAAAASSSNGPKGKKVVKRKNSKTKVGNKVAEVEVIELEPQQPEQSEVPTKPKVGKYVCPICETSFSSLSEVTTHAATCMAFG